jgi:perosamine synthetase
MVVPSRHVTQDDIDRVNSVLYDFAGGHGFLSGFFKNTLRGGQWVQRFEEAFAKYVGVKHAIAVSSGTAALHTAIEAIKAVPGDRNVQMLTSPASFVASASAILMAQGNPLFCDVSMRTFTMDPFTYEMGRRKMPTPQLIIAPHLLGHPCDMQAIEDKFGSTARVIEDCAQSLGAKYREKMTGTIGDIGCFSFQETKTLTTLGEGGMVVTNSDIYADHCRVIRNHGEKYASDSRYLGYNYRMTEAAAAFGLSQLERLDRTMALQKECAWEVKRNLPDFLEPLWVEAWADPSYFLVATKLKEGTDAVIYRNGWVERACDALGWKDPESRQPGRSISAGYSELIPDLPYFKKLVPYYNWEFPVARYLKDRMVWFDLHRWTDKETVQEKMEALKGVPLVP